MLLTLLIALLGGARASGLEAPAPAVIVELHGRVRPDLQSVVGTMQVFGGDGLRLVDTLSQLSSPDDDQVARRTFPLGPEVGWVHVDPLEGGSSWAFHSILPRRYDAAGKVPGRGLFANGLWHPQPVLGGRVPVVQWVVSLTLPEGTVGVLNGEVGAGEVRWVGQADRLALAVIPKATVTRVPLDAGELTVVERGRPRARRNLRLGEVLAAGWPGPGAPTITVVETPGRRRLARAGPGTLFLSERAMRLTDGLWRYHVPAVRRGLLEAGLPIADPWIRALAAGALSDVTADPSPKDLLGWFAWIPEVDSLLYDGRLPFFAEVFDEAWPGDPVADDLLDLVEPSTPARVVARRVASLFGAESASALGRALAAGATLAEAADAAGVPLAVLSDWKSKPATTDLSLDVAPAASGGWDLTMRRDAPTDATEEPVHVEIETRRGDPARQEDRLWIAGPGPDVETLHLDDRPARVTLDPSGDVRQTERGNDAWPARWTAVATFFPYELIARSGRVSAEADLAFRKQYDTRTLLVTGLATTPENLVSASVVAYGFAGPLLDRRARPFRGWLALGGSWLDPDFRPVDTGGAVTEAGFGAAWETRVTDTFPSRGHRLALWTDGGHIVGAGWDDSLTRWGAVRTTAKKLAPLGGRAVFAAKLHAGVASGGVEHRLLALGGSEHVQAVSQSAVVGDRLLDGGFEVRAQPVRYASVPMGLWWLSDIQVSCGLEAGALWGVDADTSRAAAIGWTAGLAGVGDVLGARPTLLGVWAAGSLWTQPAGLDSDRWPELYLRLTQAF